MKVRVSQEIDYVYESSHKHRDTNGIVGACVRYLLQRHHLCVRL